MLNYPMVSKRIFSPIRQLLQDSVHGLSFEGTDQTAIKEQIIALLERQLKDVTYNYYAAPALDEQAYLVAYINGWQEQQLPDGQVRTVLHLPAALAPVKLAVFPLTKKDGMPEKAQEIINDLRFHFNCKYEEKDQIGKRYRRMDAIGCPYCVTVDQQTLEDNTVTLRDRDTMEQKRVPISELRSIIEDKVSITSLLKKLL